MNLSVHYLCYTQLEKNHFITIMYVIVLRILCLDNFSLKILSLILIRNKIYLHCILFCLLLLYIKFKKPKICKILYYDKTCLRNKIYFSFCEGKALCLLLVSRSLQDFFYRQQYHTIFKKKLEICL